MAKLTIKKQDYTPPDPFEGIKQRFPFPTFDVPTDPNDEYEYWFEKSYYDQLQTWRREVQAYVADINLSQEQWETVSKHFVGLIDAFYQRSLDRELATLPLVKRTTTDVAQSVYTSREYSYRTQTCGRLYARMECQLRQHSLTLAGYDATIDEIIEDCYGQHYGNYRLLANTWPYMVHVEYARFHVIKRIEYVEAHRCNARVLLPSLGFYDYVPFDKHSLENLKQRLGYTE